MRCRAGTAPIGAGTSGGRPAPDGAPPNNWVASFDLSAPAWTFDQASGQWYLHLFDAGPTRPRLGRAGGGRRHARRAPVLARPRGGRGAGRRHPLHRQGPRAARRPPGRGRHPPQRPQRRTRDPRTDPGHPRRCSTATPATGSSSARCTCSPPRRWPPTTARATSSTWPSTSHPSTHPGGPKAWGECIDETVAALEPRQAWPTWVLSNHDNPRHRTRYDRSAARHGEGPDTTARRSEARARAAAVLLLTLRGTPFVFQGEELGLRRRRRAPGPEGRPRRTRRLPGPRAVGRHGRSWMAHRRRRPGVAALSTRRRDAEPRRPGGGPHLDPPPLPAPAGAAAELAGVDPRPVRPARAGPRSCSVTSGRSRASRGWWSSTSPARRSSVEGHGPIRSGRPDRGGLGRRGRRGRAVRRNIGRRRGRGPGPLTHDGRAPTAGPRRRRGGPPDHRAIRRAARST